MMERYWINAPSTFDLVHCFHGVNVLCNTETTDQYVTVYFIKSAIVSAFIDKKYLAKGWKA